MPLHFPGPTAEQIAAMDARVSCYEAQDKEDGYWSDVYTVHEQRSDGSCSCGHHKPRK